MTAERTYYSDENGVRITRTRAIFGSTTYSMANLSSVRTVVRPPNRSRGISTALVGIVTLVIGYNTGVEITAAGVVIILLGILIASMAKGIYYVMISSSSGESKAISSSDKDYINSITQALNEAIISRG